uniref:Ig-like domain-containing protein n=1 Tax=Oreochromis aureus TaxID=47969 RepID=A0A668VRI6_OREAU
CFSPLSAPHTMASLFMIMTHSFVSLAAVSSGMFVVTQSPDVSVMEGETVNITCCWTGTFERVRVNWLKNQTVIKSEINIFQSHGSLKKEAKNFSYFNISNIRTEDSGTYICKVTVEIPSLFESKGSGTIITVREKTNDTDYNNHTDSSNLPFILLVLIFCCFRNKWTTSQHHDPGALQHILTRLCYSSCVLWFL